MSASKIYIDPTEDIVFTFGKIENAPANKVVLMVPQSANIISSQVSMKLLSRLLAKSDKLIVLVTEDEMGHRFADKAGIVTEAKVSEVSVTSWERASVFKRSLQSEKNEKRKKLVDSTKGADFEIVDTKSEDLDKKTEEVEKLVTPVPVPTTTTTVESSTKSPKPLFKKLEPKLIDMDEYALISGGDIADQGQEVGLREKLLEINKSTVEEKTPVVESTVTAPASEAMASKAEPSIKSDLSSKPSSSFLDKQKEKKAKLPDNHTRSIPNRLEEPLRPKPPVPVRATKPHNTNLTGRNFARGYERLHDRPDRRVERHSGDAQRGRRTGQREDSGETLGDLKSSAGNFIQVLDVHWQKVMSGSQAKKIIALVIVLLLIVMMLMMFTTSTASVDIQLNSNSIPVSQQVTAVEGLGTVDIEGSRVPMRPILKEASRSETGDATGVGEAGNKAKGSITVFNFQNKSVSLSVGTTLTSVNNNRKYKLTKAVTVPASDKVDSISIEADGFGQEYNLSSGKKDFTISGGDNDNISIFTYSGVTGGTKEEVKVVSQENIDEIKEGLTNAIKESLKTDIATLTSDSEINLSEEVTFSEPVVEASKKAGERADTFDVTVSLTAEMIVVDKAHLNELALELIKQDSGFVGEIRVDELQDPIISNIVKESGSISFNLSASASVSAAITEESVKSRILGLSTGSAEEELSNIEGVKEITVKASPGYLPTPFRKVPEDKDNIDVTINK